MEGLNDRQRRFVEEYVASPTLNATKAAIAAGYSAKTAHAQASRLLKDVKVHAAVEAELALRSKRVRITQDWVLKQLRKNYRRAMQVELVRDNEGNPTGEHQYEGAVANKSLELMGRHLGMFVDRSEVEIRKRIADLDDDELLEEAARITREKRRG